MALSLNEQKQLQLDSQRKLAQAKSPLEKLRYTCLCRGASGINGIGRQFRIIDDDNNKLISKEEFVKVCHDFRVGLTNDETDGLFAEIDRDGSGSINFDEFLEALRVQCGFYLIFQPPMSENRKKIIELVFNKMDKTGDGADDLRGVYNVRSHPKYLNGELSEKDVLNEYLKTFESRGEKDGKVTWQEFLNYYSAVSSSIDDDVYFDLMLRNAYKL
ncbi:Calcyphosin-like protein [Echinococcus granulosus]|uniref:Calcyphosin-like protein n=1 Tax=Echinococcus granulosus TaxID=6210 RepID=W6UMM7_ECHGR|nr:Calcyphosin-like protein [Echinococcus granulosus]EUB62313.1 Calcyphosin-like protein [Echinococcus granulosus]